MKHDLDAALDQCLTWLREGMDLKSCLDRYPEYAAELRPLLELAVDVVRVRVPASAVDARAAGQRRMLAAMAQKQERLAQVHPAARFVKQMFRPLVPGRPGNLRPVWQLAAVMLMVAFLVSGWMTVAAAAGSLPGDVLYPVKLASQRAQLVLMFNSAKQRLMADQFETQQRLDIQTVLKGRRQVAVEFQGVLQQMEENLWVVGGLPVALQETTTTVGQPYLGAMVHVQADLPGNGDLVARWLTVDSTASPQPTNTAQPTTTPGATGTPETVETPEPAQTSEPTATEGPTGTPKPSHTPAPTDTPEPDDTPEDEETPEPTDTPEPGGTPEHEETPEGDDEDEREGTPDPAGTPDDDSTDEREGTPDPAETPEADDTDELGETSDPADTPDPDDEGEQEWKPHPTDTPDPDDEGEQQGKPHPTDTPDPDDAGEQERTPDSTHTPTPYDTDDHQGTPDPTEEPDD